MKKNSLIIVFILLVLLPLKVSAISQYGDVYFGSNINSCTKLQDNSLGITGVGYFSQCMQATCSGKSYNVSKYDDSKKVVCRNGNNNPYSEVTKDGCGKGYGNFYSKSCSNGTINYCTKITKYDCNKKSDGTPFEVTTKKTSSITVSTKLKSLTISNYELDFKSNVYGYSLTIDDNVNELDIKAEAEDSNAKVEINGNTNLVNGSKIVISVTVNDKKSEYVLNIVKNASTKLKSLIVTNYQLDFKSDVYGYSLIINDNVNELDIKAEAEDSNAKVEINGNTNLVNGSKIVISVTVNDKKSEYVLNIVKNASTKLKSLIVTNYQLDFKSDVYSYSLIINDNVNELDIKAEPEDSNSKVEINGNTNLVNGSVISIVVSDNNGNSNEYKISITKQISLSSNANLISLTVDEYNINFVPYMKEYKVILDKSVDYLTINYETEDKSAKVEINNNSNLKDGSKVIINVTAEDGTVNTYSLIVSLKKQSNFLGILFIIILIVALGAGGYYVYKKFFSGKKGEKYEYE